MVQYAVKIPPLVNFECSFLKILQIRRLGYFDTRNKTHISVVFITMFDIRHEVRPQLYASLKYKRSSKKLCVQLENWTQVGILNWKESEFFVTVLYRTRLNSIPVDEAPLYAFVGSNCTDPNGYIPIQGEQSKQPLTYGVCLHKGLYDLKEPQILVDWVELNIILGAEIITVYLQNVPESYYTAMLPYINKGIVEVLDWNLKPPIIPGYTKHWGQSGTITECIYRNLYRVKYLALIDVDEFIVPQEKTTVVEVLKDMEEMTKSENPASFIFYNTWFFNNNVSIPELKTARKCPRRPWPRYFTFTQQTADPEREHKFFKYHKFIAKIEGVNAAWYHWPTSVREGFSNSYRVPARYGLLHHYRVPPRARVKTKSTFVMSKYLNATMRYLTNNC